MSEPKPKDKPFEISKWVVWEAYQRVKANDGAAGVDHESIEEFEQDLKVSLRCTRRANNTETSAGRPMLMLSATRASNNARARRGVSSTRVRETSIWRMLSCHQ